MFFDPLVFHVDAKLGLAKPDVVTFKNPGPVGSLHVVAPRRARVVAPR